MEDAERPIFELVEPVVLSQGVDLVELSVVGSRSRPVVRVVVHSTAGVTHADCTRVTRVVSRALDDANAIPGSYLLEVSSPGTDRVLKAAREFDLFRGRSVRLRFSDGAGDLVATVSGSRGDAVLVARESGETEVIPWSRISKARLVPEPPAGEGKRG